MLAKRNTVRLVTPGLRRTNAHKPNSLHAQPPPSRPQLVKHALAAAVPFFGFGFVDNFVMILAGDSIDLTFGLYFGLSTMASAALGNACSDLFGVQFGNFIENFAVKTNKFASGLTQAQTNSKLARRWKHFGKASGLTIGCLLGMVPLLFIDSNRAERLKRQARIDSIFSSVVIAVGDALDAKRATVWILLEDSGGQFVWTKASKDLKDVRIPVSAGVVGRCARTGKVQNVSDPYGDPDFTQVVDKEMGLKTKSILCAPIKLGNRVVGVLEVVDKLNESSKFTEIDEELLISMASHLSLPIAESTSETDIDDKLLTTLKECEQSHRTIVFRRDSRT